jgi:hypothetical protein
LNKPLPGIGYWLYFNICKTIGQDSGLTGLVSTEGDLDTKLKEIFDVNWNVLDPVKYPSCVGVKDSYASLISTTNNGQKSPLRCIVLTLDTKKSPLLEANAQYVGAKQEAPEKLKDTESRILISYGNNETDNTNGANLVIDYSEG